MKTFYFKDDDLYFETGGDLWTILCKSGYFQGEDAVSLKTLDLFEVIQNILDIANKDKNHELISWWFSLLPAYIVLQRDFKNGKDNIHLQKIKQIALQPGVIESDERLYDRYITTMKNYKDQFPKEFRDFFDWWIS